MQLAAAVEAVEENPLPEAAPKAKGTSTGFDASCVFGCVGAVDWPKTNGIVGCAGAVAVKAGAGFEVGCSQTTNTVVYE